MKEHAIFRAHAVTCHTCLPAEDRTLVMAVRRMRYARCEAGAALYAGYIAALVHASKLRVKESNEPREPQMDGVRAEHFLRDRRGNRLV